MSITDSSADNAGKLAVNGKHLKPVNIIGMIKPASTIELQENVGAIILKQKITEITKLLHSSVV